MSPPNAPPKKFAIVSPSPSLSWVTPDIISPSDRFENIGDCLRILTVKSISFVF